MEQKIFNRPEHTDDPIGDVLRRHNIQDAEEYLMNLGDNIEIGWSNVQDVMTQGHIQLTMGLTASRTEIDHQLAKLKYL